MGVHTTISSAQSPHAAPTLMPRLWGRSEAGTSRCWGAPAGLPLSRQHPGDGFVTPTTTCRHAEPSGAAQGPLSQAVGLLRIKAHGEIKSLQCSWLGSRIVLMEPTHRHCLCFDSWVGSKCLCHLRGLITATGRFQCEDSVPSTSVEISRRKLNRLSGGGF